MPSVKLREKESFEKMFRRFKEKVEKSGIIAECQKRKYYTKPSEKRKLARKAAIIRTRQYENSGTL